VREGVVSDNVTRGRSGEREDVYSRVDYRRLVAWPERIEREWPFLRQVLGDGGRVLDLGCGTGEHSRFLASKGFEVVGIDASPSMLEKATDAPSPGNVRFLAGDIADVAQLVDGAFDGAVCLGNTLPHLETDASMRRLLAGLHDRLRPGAPLLLQILNYERIFESRQRFLPLNFRQGEAPGEEIVFLRLMTPRQDGTLVFNPCTLRYRPGLDPPLEVVSARNVPLRGWRLAELEGPLREAGFRGRTLYGTVGDIPYSANDSSDLVIVAIRDR
jgi:SAM-dependent methyltransferase